ncbi:MAG: metal-dependent hydrolase [Methanothrix sp.]|nr:metal-dependent hydrolase [Methanothrix sp.]
MLLFAHVGLALASARLLSRVSLPFLALGSMLPDIIDKPLGLIVFGSPNMGRIVAHTLLFLMLLSALSIYFRDIRLFSLTWGVLIHISLDFMWNSPKTFLWPFLGPFPSAPLLDTMSYLEMLLCGLKNPGVLIPEIAGLAYIIFFAYARRRQALACIDHHLKRPREKAGCILGEWKD